MRPIPLLMVVVMLGGCGAHVTMFGHTVSKGKQSEQVPAAQVPAGAAEAAVAPAGAVKAEPVVRDVLLALNATLKQQVAADAHFDSETLHASITKELRSRGLMGPLESTSGTAIDILIDTYSLQASVGRLAGLVRVLDEAGREQRSFKAQAEATMQVPVKAGDPAALSALYGKFAEQVASGLLAK